MLSMFNELLFIVVLITTGRSSETFSIEIRLYSFPESRRLVKGFDADLPLCAAWKTEGVTVAGHEDGEPGDAVDALNEPVGLYAARDGTVYVADQGNHRVMRFTLNGSRNGTPIGDGKGNEPRQLDSPNAVVVDEATNAVFISDFGNRRIQLWREGEIGVGVETVIGKRDLNRSDTEAFYGADGIQLDPRSNDILYISEAAVRTVSRWKLRAKHSNSSSRLFHTPRGIHVDAEQNTYVVHYSADYVSKCSLGKCVPVKVQSGYRLPNYQSPSTVTVDSDGRLFIADTGNDRIMRWQLNAADSTCIAGCSETRGNRTDQLAEPRDLMFDWKGNLLVADTANNRVQRFHLFIDAECGKYRALIVN